MIRNSYLDRKVMQMSFNMIYVISAMRLASKSIGTTLFMAIVSLAIGIVFGIIIALIRNFKIIFLARFLKIVITLLKGVPIILIILGTFLVMSEEFNSLAKSWGWSVRYKDVNPVWIAIFALSIMAIINVSEIFRGAFSSIKQGQYDAAKSIGLTKMQMIRRVMIPQAIPVAIPMMSNLLIGIVKASALASMVGVVDIFSAASISAQKNYSFLEAYVGVAIIYWIISLFIENFSNLIERVINKKIRGSLS